MNYWLKVSLVVVIAGVLLAGCGTSEEPVETVVNAEELLKVTEAFGTVVSKETENITLEFPAKVQEVVANNGQQVSKGDVLFVLDMSEYMAQLQDKEHELAIKKLELSSVEGEEGDVSKLEDSAAIQLEAEKSELDRLTKRYNDLKSKYDNGTAERLIQIRNQIETNQTAYDNAALELANSKVLYDEGVISSTELKDVEAREAMAQDALVASQLDYDLEKKALADEVSTLWYQMEMSRSRVQNLEMDMGNSTAGYEMKLLEVSTIQNSYDQMFDKVDLPYVGENGQIICPVDEGIFYNFHLSEGDYISGGMERTFSIAEAGELEIHTTISEDFIKDVELGAPVTIRPIAAREKEYHGTVSYIADMAEQVNGDSVILVHVTIDDNDGFLKPNFSVDMEIEEIRDETEEVVVVEPAEGVEETEAETDVTDEATE